MKNLFFEYLKLNKYFKESKVFFIFSSLDSLSLTNQTKNLNQIKKNNPSIQIINPIKKITFIESLKIEKENLLMKIKRKGPYLNNNFISFYNTDKDISYCKGWKKGDNTSGAIKWNIKIKKDEWDEFWFDYDYYGTDQEIEYTILYKYEVIDSLLHFSNTEGQEFIFHPSDKNYSKDIVDTGEIIELTGCMFF